MGKTCPISPGTENAGTKIARYAVSTFPASGVKSSSLAWHCRPFTSGPSYLSQQYLQPSLCCVLTFLVPLPRTSLYLGAPSSCPAQASLASIRPDHLQG